MTALDHNNALTPPFPYQRQSNLPACPTSWMNWAIASAWFSEERGEVSSSQMFVEQDKGQSRVMYSEQTEYDFQKDIFQWYFLFFCMYTAEMFTKVYQKKGNVPFLRFANQFQTFLRLTQWLGIHTLCRRLPFVTSVLLSKPASMVLCRVTA